MSMERDYWKLRDVETRYRLLFDASSQPVLLISADQLRVVEANPAAIRTLGVGSDNDLLSQMLPAQREAFRAMLQRVREQGKAPGIVMHLGQDRHAWLVRASLVAAEPGAVFVLQLSEAGMAPRVIEPAPTTKVDFEEIVDRLPHGHVVLDAQGKVLSANRAFLEMVGLMEDASAVGAPIARWLGRSEAEASILLGTAESLGAVTEFPSTIRGNEGRVSDVAISVVRNADAASNTVRFGVLLRPVDTTRPAAVPPLGRVSLREIIQTTVASVERRCIEAALEQAGGNRTIAAQMLGLSRQALYLKLNRYTQGEEVDGEPA
jgi:transcriptional regulator PpsR